EFITSFFAGNTARDRYLCENWIAVGPGQGAPLRPGVTYAAMLTTGIQGPSGTVVARDSDFVAMLSASAPSDPTLARAYTAYAPLRAYLAARGIDPGTILDAAVFTTQNPTAVARALRDAVR